MIDKVYEDSNYILPYSIPPSLTSHSDHFLQARKPSVTTSVLSPFRSVGRPTSEACSSSVWVCFGLPIPFSRLLGI